MYRLVAYAPNGVERFPVDRDVLLIGSGEHCDVRLAHAGVGREHARLERRGDEVTIEDLGARKGVMVNGRRQKQARLEVLDEVRLGSIALLLEDVKQESKPEEEAPPTPEPKPTITPAGMLEHLARVSQWVLADSSSSITLESLVVALLKDFGGGVLFLFQGEPEERGIKFVVASEARWLGSGEELLGQIYERLEVPEPGPAAAFFGTLEEGPAWIAWRHIRALDRPYLFAVALPRFRPEDDAADGNAALAALGTLADQLILGLVHHVGQYEPILFGRRAAADLQLAPGLMVGESEAMQRMLDQLRTAIDPPVSVLLRGESGVGKELFAKTLHLSSPRTGGPFIAATCHGAQERQLEADLFGAEIRGKSGPVVREGKFLEADGGTLYLENVELLPLGLQDRLVRFLRSGEVVPASGQGAVATVDVRLVVSSSEPLEALVSRDQFRVDLAHRLAQFTIDVPPLRERREDLPLLIQAAVNRCCHESGKRVQGITVKALEALAVYDYPGNLPELENIVRRLVYLCPAGKPIQSSILPEEVRLAEITRHRPTAESELDLEKLVAECERAAIREALRRSEGNKSAAARELRLSRNGLAMKMNRLGLS